MYGILEMNSVRTQASVIINLTLDFSFFSHVAKVKANSNRLVNVAQAKMATHTEGTLHWHSPMCQLPNVLLDCFCFAGWAASNFSIGVGTMGAPGAGAPYPARMRKG